MSAWAITVHGGTIMVRDCRGRLVDVALSLHGGNGTSLNMESVEARKLAAVLLAAADEAEMYYGTAIADPN